jgi:hypothetical protein
MLSRIAGDIRPHGDRKHYRNRHFDRGDLLVAPFVPLFV